MSVAFKIIDLPVRVVQFFAWRRNYKQKKHDIQLLERLMVGFHIMQMIALITEKRSADHCADHMGTTLQQTLVDPGPWVRQ